MPRYRLPAETENASLRRMEDELISEFEGLDLKNVADGDSTSLLLGHLTNPFFLT